MPLSKTNPNRAQQGIELVSLRSKAWLYREDGTGLASGVLGRYVFDASQARTHDGSIDLERIGFSPTNYRRFNQRVVWFDKDTAAWVDVDRAASPMTRTRYIDPASPTALDDLTAELAAVPLDHAQPLWDTTIIDGLSGDRVAVLYRIHEALSDGTLTPFDAVENEQRPAQPTRGEAKAAQRRARSAALRRVLPTMHRSFAQAVRVATRAVRTRNPWMRGVCTGERLVRSFRVPLSAITSARAEHAASFTDILLSAIGDGLHRGLAASGVRGGSIGLMNVAASHEAASTSISAWFIRTQNSNLPFRDRCAEVVKATSKWRARNIQSGAQLLTDVGMFTWRNARPPKHRSPIAHVVVSNVGSFAPMFAFSAAPMLEVHFVGAVTAQGPINVSIVSGPEDAFISMQVDLGAIPFGLALADGLHAALCELSATTCSGETGDSLSHSTKNFERTTA